MGIGVARILLILLACTSFAACARVETFSLALDPSGNKLPPRGYIAFCKDNPDLCQKGQEQRVVFTPQRWAQLEHANAFYNTSIAPSTDVQRFGQREHWDFPDTSGDCEDYVLAKKAYLTALGFPGTSLLIAVVDIPEAPALSRRHAVLLALTDLGNFVLDNRHPEIKRWGETEYIWVAVESTSDPDAWQGVKSSLASR